MKNKKIKIVSLIILFLVLTGFFYFLLNTQIKLPKSALESSKHEKLVDLMNVIKKEFNIPALGVIMLNSENITTKALIGTKEIEKNSMPTFEDHFHLGSNTKAITGFIAAKLVEDEIINWDTKFFYLFPELENESRKEYYDITLSELLSHRAHLPPYRTNINKIAEQIPINLSARDKRIAFARIILEEEPVEPLFSKYKYSNAGYVLASIMVERASNMSWEELVQKMFVEDLDFSINIGWPIDIDENQPRGHLPGSYIERESNELIVFDKEYHNINEEILNPSGELNMNMLDYAYYIQLNLQGLQGTNNYLLNSTYDYLHFGIDKYSIGWENHRSISEHSGSKGNFFVHTYIDKEKDMAIIVFANSGILNALNPLEYFFGGIKLDKYLKKIKEIEEDEK